MTTREQSWQITLLFVGMLVGYVWLATADTRPVEPVSAAPYLTVSGVPTLAPPRKAGIADDVCDLHNWDRLWNIRIKDGDTLKADIDLGRGVMWMDRDIRIKNFDAWESHRYRQTVLITDAEIAKGKRAEAALESLLLSPRTSHVLLGPGSTAEYGREEGSVYAIRDDGQIVDTAQWMLEHDHDRNVKPDGTKR